MAPLGSRPRVHAFLAGMTLPRAVGAIVASAIALTLIAAAVPRAVERETSPSFGDACWWAIQTVATVGHGDNVPRTDVGRVVAAAVTLVGLALVPTVTSVVPAMLLARALPSSSSASGEDSSPDPGRGLSPPSNDSGRKT